MSMGRTRGPAYARYADVCGSPPGALSVGLYIGAVDCVDRKAAIAHRGRLHNNDAPRPGRCIEAPLGDEQVIQLVCVGSDALKAGMVGPFRLC